jgi:hypothetical protein
LSSGDGPGNDQRTIERAAVILRGTQRYSGDELEAALEAARRAIGGRGQREPCSDRSDRRRPIDRAQ